MPIQGIGRSAGGGEHTVEWPTPDNVGAMFTTRVGGVSRSPYGAASTPMQGMPLGMMGVSALGQEIAWSGDGLNLGYHTGDSTRAVAENRRRVQAAIGDRRIAWLDQIHGTDVVEAHVALASVEPLRADAVVTDRPGLACAIMVADCLPVLLCAQKGGAVGAAHAGWRGLLAGVLENAALAVGRLSHGDMQTAYIGPAIGPSAFEVGAEVREAFLDAALPDERDATNAAFSLGAGAEAGSRLAAATEVSRSAISHPLSTSPSSAMAMSAPSAKYLADLPMLARLRLRRVGITAIFGGEVCTFSDPVRFYSYRRDGQTGRQGALIWR